MLMNIRTESYATKPMLGDGVLNSLNKRMQITCKTKQLSGGFQFLPRWWNGLVTAGSVSLKQP